MLSGKKLLYLMEIHRLRQEHPGKLSLLAVGRAMNVKKPTVHSMVRDLDVLGLAENAGPEGVRLTEKGESIARRYWEYRAALNAFFMDSMELTPKEADLCAVELLACLPEERLESLLARAAKEKNGCMAAGGDTGRRNVCSVAQGYESGGLTV